MQIGPLHVWVEQRSNALMLGNKAAYDTRPAQSASRAVAANTEYGHLDQPPVGLVDIGTFAAGRHPPVRFRVEPRFDAGPIQAVFAPLRSTAIAKRCVDYLQLGEDHHRLSEGLAILRQGRVPAIAACEGAQPPDAFSLVTELIFQLMRDAPPAAILHGSCIDLHGKRVAFLGKSGSGKTMLAAWFAGAEGARGLADDCVLMMPTASVFALPLASGVKAGSWDVLRPFFPQIDAAPRFTKQGTPLTYISTGEGVHSGEVGPADLLVFPTYEPTADPKVTPLTDVEILLQLVKGGAWIAPDSMKQIVSTLCSTPAIALRHNGDMDVTRALLYGALKG